MGQSIPATDDEGYLPDPPDCKAGVALAIARKENIPVTESHRESGRCMRDYHGRYRICA